ncbi:hypothetical protein EG68_07201 [Paragonimus skrjabini miyazakii]|uniref:Palmitoyltransferase n=1 Tax=Paragonimus skrjabini miyazakii TaxID=59628 RepID=A0A8S9YCL1_9TREM|nr:hypothetical protein EG68_07201 [Paragonimus skrjabini miyazakii]
MRSKGRNACSRCCISFVNWLPVIFLALIIAWSYYAFVYSLCIVLVQSLTLRIVFLVFYHIFLAIFAWSYAKVILEPPKSPPSEFFLTNEDWESLHNVHSSQIEKNSIIERLVEARNLPIRMVGRDGGINVCQTCGLIKPDRAHHCSACGKCVLQLDHHCPWTNNCVGFHNHKYFIIFLGWGTVYCLYIVCTSAAYFFQFWTVVDLSVDRFQVLFLFIVAAMFGLCQLALGGYHCYLVGRNQTTLETFSTPKFRDGSSDPRAFDIGRKANLQEVFGRNCCLAILPVKTTLGDGIHFRYRSNRNDLGLLENGNSSPTPLATGF